MNKKRIVSAVLVIVLLLMVVAYGVRGLVINIRTDEPLYVSYENFANNPKQYKNYLVMLDSARLVNDAAVTAAGDGPFRIVPFTIGGEGRTGDKYRFFIKFASDHQDIVAGKDTVQTLSGILKSLKGGDRKEFPDPQIVDEDAFLIDTYSHPLAWYWNLLLIFVPQIFIFLLANQIYLLSKKQTPSL